MAGERVVLTGAAGHLGAHLAPRLADAGFEVIGVDRVPPPAPPQGWTALTAELGELDRWRPALEGAAVVVHAASIHPWKRYTDDQYLDANVAGTWHLYAAVAAAGVSRVVLTSSIAAGGYGAPAESWPKAEDTQLPLSDLYAFTKHAQEDVARLWADRGAVRTLALRPPAFMPVDELETGFRLTGAYTVVDDVADAHSAAVEALLGRRGEAARAGAFEAVHVTNPLPYTAADADVFGADRNTRGLVERHWPEAYPWLTERGFQGSWLPAVYDLAKAARLLDWRPRTSFDTWLAGQRQAGAARA